MRFKSEGFAGNDQKQATPEKNRLHKKGESLTRLRDNYGKFVRENNKMNMKLDILLITLTVCSVLGRWKFLYYVRLCEKIKQILIYF